MQGGLRVDHSPSLFALQKASSTSAYVYMPPKHTWWKAIAAFTAGGICVFALVRSPAGPQAAPEVSRSAAVAAAASQASSPPQAFLAAPTE